MATAAVQDPITVQQHFPCGRCVLTIHYKSYILDPHCGTQCYLGDQGKQGYQNSQNYRLQDFILSGDGLKTMRPGGRTDLRDQ